MSPDVVHTIAKVGFGAGTNDLYDKSRPSYPEEALSTLQAAIASKSNIRILELGSGTGIFTRALLTHPTFGPAIKELRAVEPSEGMRDKFSESTSDSRVSLSGGTFNHTGSEDGWADLIVVAQVLLILFRAWHWCHPDYNDAILELSRVLKPNGVAAFIWNLEDREAARWVAQIRDTIEIYENGTPQFRLNFWRQTFSTLAYLEHFKAPEEHTWSRVIPTTEEGVYNRAFSKSYVAALGDEEKVVVRSRLRSVLERAEERIWIDEASGVFEYPYKTFLVLMHKAQ